MSENGIGYTFKQLACRYLRNYQLRRLFNVDRQWAVCLRESKADLLLLSSAISHGIAARLRTMLSVVKTNTCHPQNGGNQNQYERRMFTQNLKFAAKLHLLLQTSKGWLKIKVFFVYAYFALLKILLFCPRCWYVCRVRGEGTKKETKHYTVPRLSGE